MSSLVVENVPPAIIAQLRRLAQDERRSLEEQVLVLLKQALQQEGSNFLERHEAFVRQHGPPPFENDVFGMVRSQEAGRPAVFGGSEHAG